MPGRYLLVLAVAVTLAGCASAPTATDLSAVLETPHEFEGSKVELSAVVAENVVPQGEEYRTWTFVLDSCDMGRLTAVEEGFNPAVIQEAFYLVDKARLEGGLVTVTGDLTQTEDGLRLKVASVKYGDTLINTDAGPFVPNDYGDDRYPGTPHYYDGHLYYAGAFPAEEYDVVRPRESQMAQGPIGCQQRM